MSLPELSYQAGLVAALLLAPFNRMAAVVILVWVFGVFGMHLGVPEGQIDIIGDTAGLCYALAYCMVRYQPSSLFAAILFAPMIANDVAVIKGWADSYYTYWARYGLAMAQLLALPGGTDWGRVRRTWCCYRKSATVDWFARLLARRHAL